MEHLLGSIEVGKRADLVVLTDDIMQVPPERIHKADVALTMVDGRLVYESMSPTFPIGRAPELLAG